MFLIGKCVSVRPTERFGDFLNSRGVSLSWHVGGRGVGRGRNRGRVLGEGLFLSLAVVPKGVLSEDTLSPRDVFLLIHSRVTVRAWKVSEPTRGAQWTSLECSSNVEVPLRTFPSLLPPNFQSFPKSILGH